MPEKDADRLTAEFMAGLIVRRFKGARPMAGAMLEEALFEAAATVLEAVLRNPEAGVAALEEIEDLEEAFRGETS